MIDKTRTETTRERLIEIAGQTFAARGFEGATAKEICERAGANPAAVNYHFGGIDGLYEAVLVEAQRRAHLIDRLPELLASPRPMAEKLRLMMGLVTGVIVAPGPSAWILGLFSRELTRPTAVGRRIIAATVAPRLVRVRAMVGEFVGLAPDDPRVALACVSLAAPLIMMLIADHEVLRDIHPPLALTPENQDAIAGQLAAFAMAGLLAVKAGAAADQN
jgi:AcrR family transcriptional regulator